MELVEVEAETISHQDFITTINQLGGCCITPGSVVLRLKNIACWQ